MIVTRFICKDTIEERIDMVLRQKRELFESVLGDGKTTNASLSLTASEIFGLFDLKAKDTKRLADTARSRRISSLPAPFSSAGEEAHAA